MTTTIADLATLEDAVVRAAVRFIGCAGEFEGKLEYCGEWLDALETAVVRLEKGREENLGDVIGVICPKCLKARLYWQPHRHCEAR